MQEYVHHLGGDTFIILELKGFDDGFCGTAMTPTGIRKQEENVWTSGREVIHWVSVTHQEGEKLTSPGGLTGAWVTTPFVHSSGIPGQYPHPAERPSTHSHHTGAACAGEEHHSSSGREA